MKLNLYSESTMIGREKELKELLDDLNYDKSIRLVTGETGVDKSVLLDKFNETLTRKMKDDVFVGYYSRRESLIAGSESLDYPLRIVLERLVKHAQESQHLKERLDNTISRIKRGLLKSVKDQGIKWELLS